MLIDDDSDDREFFMGAVETLGDKFSCQLAENGIEALGQLRGNNPLPNYIFLDLNLPFMSGRECLAELKKDPALKNIPVIIYTTTTFAAEVDATREMGAVVFVPKPMNVSALPDVILSAIESAEAYHLA